MFVRAWMGLVKAGKAAVKISRENSCYKYCCSYFSIPTHAYGYSRNNGLVAIGKDVFRPFRGAGFGVGP